MKDVLLELLQRLESVGDKHEEVYDSAVRDVMSEAVMHGFIRPRRGYVLPDKFAMFSAEGDRLVRGVLTWFLPAARAAAKRAKLDTFHKRLAAFQDIEVQTAETTTYDDFFGWWDPEQYDEAGKLIEPS